MRGKHCCRGRPPPKIRITPAHAGKTDDTVQRERMEPDHPRACGENYGRKIYHGLHCGSPPRMRGKPRGCRAVPCATRITPAHAGKTVNRDVSHYAAPDHPRACGENAGKGFAGRVSRGSPPRMRGKPGCDAPVGRDERITPAHAGKTCKRLISVSRPADHPRACGENLGLCPYIGHSSGSPPRMRGKRHPHGVWLCRVRITPAHAGKTPIGSKRALSRPDHPRACGENLTRSVVRS